MFTHVESPSLRVVLPAGLGVQSGFRIAANAPNPTTTGASDSVLLPLCRISLERLNVESLDAIADLKGATICAHRRSRGNIQKAILVISVRLKYRKVRV